MRVLHVTPSFHPAVAFGGPIHSTKSLCDYLAVAPDIRLHVLTTDASGDQRACRLALRARTQTFAAGYHVRYCRRLAAVSVSTEMLARLPAAIRWAQIVHLTGVYSFPSLPVLSLCRALGKPLVWSPRGSLQASAQWREVPKNGLKRMFESFCGMIASRRVLIHTTSQMEADFSAKRMPGVPMIVIPNAIAVPPDQPNRHWRPGGTLRLMFMSRLHPKKGLDMLIDAMTQLGSHVRLDIYGAGEPDHEQHFHRAVAARHLGDRVRFHGHVEGAAKRAAFDDADLFCLPTNSENFGIVVGEALAHGVPVVTTMGAPWAGLRTHDCGRWIAPDQAALRTAISQLETADLAQMGGRGRAWMAQAFAPQPLADQMAQTYRTLVAGNAAIADQGRVLCRP